MYSACFEAKEEPDRNYDINYFVYENNEEKVPSAPHIWENAVPKGQRQ